MREAVRVLPNVRFLDTARVNDVVISDAEQSHAVHWTCRATQQQGMVLARWVVDCSGRNRLLARKLGHCIDLDDGFQTTAVWGQFDGITDDLFGTPWVYTYADGDQTSRDLHTLHLWGEGYWIWGIRLSKQRISVGVTFNQCQAPPGETPREQFWEIINRHQPLRRVISDEQMLEFRMYRNVQHMTDTFVSAQRYGMVGDAASIVDAYYSQGISLALVSSWHMANLVEQDLRHGGMDAAYLLSHLLDLAIFWSAGASRSRLAHWLVGTGGDTRQETPEQRGLRDYLSRHMFYSQTKPWHWLAPETVRRLQGHLQEGIGRRARWRLAHGIRVPALKSVVRFTAPAPRLWKLPFLHGQERADLSAEDVVHPGKFQERLPAFLRFLLPGAPTERLGWAIRARGQTLLLLFLLGYVYDWADTEIQKLLLCLRRLSPGTREAVAAPASVCHSGPAGVADEPPVTVARIA